MISDGRNLPRISSCSECNGYGYQYVRGSAVYPGDGTVLHQWTECPHCGGKEVPA